MRLCRRSEGFREEVNGRELCGIHSEMVGLLIVTLLVARVCVYFHEL